MFQGEVANLRRSIKASQKEKTALTLKFNQVLKETANEYGFYYIEITQSIINNQTGMLDDYFLMRQINEIYKIANY